MNNCTLLPNQKTALYNEAFRLLREVKILLLKAQRKHIMYSLRNRKQQSHDKFTTSNS